MIGQLPKSLEVNGIEYEIRSDFRVALLIFQSFNDANLKAYEKVQVCLECLYINVPTELEEAYKKAVWFLNGGEENNEKPSGKKVFDWDQDERIIFSAVNKVAGYETRSADFLHWWTFLGYFCEVGEGLFSQIVNIRSKKAKGKKLEKWERDFYSNHKEMIDIKKSYSDEELAEIEYYKKLLD